MLVQPAAPQVPQAEIANARIRAQLYLPDAQAGYYRGTRFDWSGVVSSLKWNGHEYFGQWFERHDPKIHDAITGRSRSSSPARMPALGYDEAKPGETLRADRRGRRPQAGRTGRYRRFATYDIVDPGEWTVKKAPTRIEFVHRLGDTDGYAYVYRKTLRLVKDTLVLEHRLKNTGRKPIATSVYNHNFFTLDGDDRAGHRGAVAVRAAGGAPAERSRRGPRQGNRVPRPFEQKETVFTEVEGFGATARDYDFRIENRKTGAGVRMTGDRPLSKLLFWSAGTDRVPRAVHRRPRRARQGVVVADHLPVLPGRRPSQETPR